MIDIILRGVAGEDPIGGLTGVVKRWRGVGVNNKKGMMKTSWGKPVHVISFIRTLLIVLAVAVCTVAAVKWFHL